MRVRAVRRSLQKTGLTRLTVTVTVNKSETRVDRAGEERGGNGDAMVMELFECSKTESALGKVNRGVAVLALSLIKR